MELLLRRGEDIVDQADPSELLDGLRSQAKALSPDTVAKLDFVLRQWTVRAISRAGDVEGLLELDDLVTLAIRALPETSRQAFGDRWQAFRDLLESKRLATGGRASGRARNLLHADRILEEVRPTARAQSDLQRALGISAQRLSQVLGVMEEGGLIQRQKRGKEKFVLLVSNGQRVGAAASVATPVCVPKSVGRTVWAA